MRLGVINLTHSSRAAIKFAQAAEAAGFWGVGIGDTVPERYQDTYVTAAACFAATERVHIGPTVTNTVTRHWSVLGATARTFGELYPGRFFAGRGDRRRGLPLGRPDPEHLGQARGGRGQRPKLGARRHGSPHRGVGTARGRGGRAGWPPT